MTELNVIEEGRAWRRRALASEARLAEAERLLRELPVACACECWSDVKASVDTFLRASDSAETRETAP